MFCRNYLIYLEGIESGTSLRQSTQIGDVNKKISCGYMIVVRHFEINDNNINIQRKCLINFF
jgi:hypothetical protein